MGPWICRSLGVCVCEPVDVWLYGPVGQWVLISRKTWAASLLLVAASLRRKENKSDFPLSLSLSLIFTKHLLRATPCAGHWGTSQRTEGNRQNLPSWSVCVLGGAGGLLCARCCAVTWPQGLVTSHALGRENRAVSDTWGCRAWKALKT